MTITHPYVAANVSVRPREWWNASYSYGPPAEQLQQNLSPVALKVLADAARDWITRDTAVELAVHLTGDDAIELNVALEGLCRDDDNLFLSVSLREILLAYLRYDPSERTNVLDALRKLIAEIGEEA